jgi:hypothetical protein
MDIIKYPRTPHIYGSRIQKGDEDLEAVRLEDIQDNHFVIEEKMDGANCAVSFDEHGQLHLQSRWHFLTGGPRERHFNLLKQWANKHQALFYNVLENRYTMYGEWMYAKHTVFYDNLPDYFMEFDILDRQEGKWLSTQRRNELLKPIRQTVHPVRVLLECDGKDLTTDYLAKMVVESPFITSKNILTLREYCIKNNLDEVLVSKETDSSRLMEGLYIKTETDEVTGRYKWVRKTFIDTMAQSNSHWQSRSIIPNKVVKYG